MLLEKGGVPDLAEAEDGVRIGGGRGGAGVAAEAPTPRARQLGGTSSGKAWLGQHVVAPVDALLVRFHLRQPPRARLDRKRSIVLQRTLTEQSVQADASYAKFKAQIKTEEAREFGVKLTVSLSRAPAPAILS